MRTRLCLLVTAAFYVVGCSSFEASHQKLPDFPKEGPERLAHVGIGTFTIVSAGQSTGSSIHRTLVGTLAFALRAEGFRVLEAAEVERVLERSELPTIRLLNGEELLQLSGRLAPRFLLQGEVHETVTHDLVDEHVQVMLSVFVHDMTNGRKVAEVRVFGRNLAHYTAREAFQASRLLARSLGSVVREGATK